MNRIGAIGPASQDLYEVAPGGRQVRRNFCACRFDCGVAVDGERGREAHVVAFNGPVMNEDEALILGYGSQEAGQPNFPSV